MFRTFAAWAMWSLLQAIQQRLCQFTYLNKIKALRSFKQRNSGKAARLYRLRASKRQSQPDRLPPRRTLGRARDFHNPETQTGGQRPPAADTKHASRLFGLVDDPRTALHHLVLVRQTIERLGCAKKQITTWFQRGMNAREDVFLHLRGEVDQYVAAEHDVEFAQR